MTLPHKDMRGDDMMALDKLTRHFASRHHHKTQIRSFEDQLDKYRGIGPGFDFLRIALAVSIVMTHAALLTERGWIRGTPLWYVEYALVPMFFALSGFLVTGSASRLSLGNFLINRGLRIVPALGVDVVICALIFGPIMTTATYSDYFSDPDFFRYFWNITGYIHYQLPGVFKENPSSYVNGALWTVPYEILCYVFMSGLMIFGFVRRRIGVVGITVLYLSLGFLVEQGVFETSSDMLNWLLHALFVSRGSQLITAFLMGILLYQYRSWVPYNNVLAGLCAVIVIASIFLMKGSYIASIPNRIYVLPALMYLTIWIGITNIPIPNLFRRGDYSYGIYLYHDPILQVIIAVLPLSLITGTGGWLLLIAFGLPIVSCLAAFSWHNIEKPILSLRKKFSFVAKMRGVDEAAQSAADKK